MNSLKTKLMVFFVVFFSCSWALAKPPKSETKKKNNSLESAPIQILSDSLKVLQKQHHAVFSGNVRVTQGQLHITCRKLTVSYSGSPAAKSNGKIRSMLFTGDVMITQGHRTGHCENALYSKTESRLVCTGDPWVKDRQSHIRGDKIVYLLDKDEVQVTRPRAVVDVSDEKNQDSH